MVQAVQAVQAQEVFDIPQNSKRVPLLQSLEFFIDDSGQWQPDSGALPPVPWQKLRDRSSEANFGALAHPVWFRVVLRSATASEWMWVVPHPQIEWLQLWVKPQDGQMQRFSAGLGPIEQEQARPQRHPALAIALGENTPSTVLMRVQSKGLLQVPVELWLAEDLLAREQRTLTALGACFGLLAGLLIYNGFLALKLRDKAYAQYIAMGVAQGIFQLSNTGLGHLYVWTEQALSSFLIRSVSLACFAALALIFTNSFLRLDRKLPTISGWLWASAACWALVLVAHLWVDTQTLVRTVTVPLGLWTVLIILFAGVTGWSKGIPAAGYFALAWSGVVVAGVVRVLLNLGLLPPHPLLYDGLLIASTVEMLLLSLALADRIMAERRARAEADVQRAREQVAREAAQRALQEKTRFMAAVTHDLQQPIYALSLATESVSRRRADVVSTDTLNQMQSALFAADELLSSLAMHVRLDRDDLQPEIEAFSVQNMLERIDALFATRAQQQGLRWRVLPSLCEVHSNPLLLERMVCNLVSNAMRYTPAGGVLLSCRVRPKHLLIQVWDTGPGIPEHQHATIFEAHYRGSAAQKHDKGLGLGLSIVRRCAELLNVRVGLKSVPGRGSCFALWVPLATPP